jgi:hypothetical protein
MEAFTFVFAPCVTSMKPQCTTMVTLSTVSLRFCCHLFPLVAIRVLNFPVVVHRPALLHCFFVKGQLLFLRHCTLSTQQPCFSCCHASFTHLRLQKACYMSSPAYPTCNPQFYPLVPSISRFTFAHFRFFNTGSFVNMFSTVPHPPL